MPTLTGPKRTRVFSLFTLAALSVFASFIILLSCIVITRDKHLAVIPILPLQSEMMTLPFLNPIHFTDDVSKRTEISITVATDAKTENNQSVECTSDGTFECYSLHMVTNATEIKTMSLGIVQHPGIALVAYGIPASFLYLTAVVTAFLFADLRLLYTSFTAFSSLLFMLAVTEFTGPVHILSAYVCFTNTMLFFFFVSRNIKKWYKCLRLFMVCFWTSVLLQLVWGILSITSTQTKGYVALQISVIASLLPLQFLLAHVLSVMGPVTIGVRVSERCKEFEIDTMEHCVSADSCEHGEAAAECETS